MSTVLVTGGTGFLGSHTLIHLLQAGHTVRTTVRSPDRVGAVRAMLTAGCIERDREVSVHVADLSHDAGWEAAARGCDAVLHMASPFPGGTPQKEDDLILPARDGTLRVLRAARDGGVKRVVVTSSFAAVGYGHPRDRTTFSEEDWTDPRGTDVAPYIKSKTLAERAAWEFLATNNTGMEMSVINPVGIFGPVLGPDYSASIGLINALLTGAMPATPRIYFGVVDVRDVAALHLLAMARPEANGQRFIAVAPDPAISLHEAALMLRRRLGPAARKVPRHQFPDWIVRVLAKFSPGLRGTLPQLGIVRNSTGAKAQTLLGWRPRCAEEAIVASGASLLTTSRNERTAAR